MEELDLSQLFELFWNRKIQIILILIMFIILGVTYTMCFVTPVYTSATTLVLATEQSSESTPNSSITTTDVTLNSKLVSTYRELVKSDKVVRKVINNLNIDIAEDSLKNNISVKVVSDSELIQISVTNEDAKLAADIANEVAKVFTEQVKEIYNINNVHVVDEAEEEANPSNINHVKDVIIFVFMGIVLSIVYVLLENMLDTTIKTGEDIEKQFSVTVLASIPFDNSEKRKGGRK